MFNKKLFIAGHQGMLGSAIYRSIKRKDIRILLATRKQLDLENFTDNQSDDNNLYDNIISAIVDQDKFNIELKTKYLNIIEKLNIKNLNDNVIKNLDNNITTYGQAISMNNYETNI